MTETEMAGMTVKQAKPKDNQKPGNQETLTFQHPYIWQIMLNIHIFGKLNCTF